MSKIRKVNTGATPTQSRSQYGPATAGVEFNTVKDAIEVNPDGVFRQLGNVVVSASTAPTTEQHATGTVWVKQDNDKVYVNTGTLTTPAWQILN